MPIFRHDAGFTQLSEKALANWAAIPPAIASDCMNRSQAMDARIKPLAPGTRLTGQARTVACMVGDNGAIHAAIRLIGPGDVLVIAAGGYTDTALWGGLLTQAAQSRGAAGVVIDGAARDIAEVRETGFPCFAAAAVPAGPHRIAVVPLARAEVVLADCLAKLAQEQEALEHLRQGTMLADQMGIPEPEPIG
jgi:regulator of RNase E activity RraA